MAEEIPVYLELHLRAMRSDGAKSAEVIQLIAQVMRNYAYMPIHERAAIASWFSQTYGEDHG